MEQAKQPKPPVCIRVKDASVRFNMAAERVDNLKEFENRFIIRRHYARCFFE